MSFSNDIRKIRLDCFYSQEEFAKEIGVSVITINRWENNKALPNLKVRKSIDAFCKEHNIDFDIRMLNSLNNGDEE